HTSSDRDWSSDVCSSDLRDATADAGIRETEAAGSGSSGTCPAKRRPISWSDCSHTPAYGCRWGRHERQVEKIKAQPQGCAFVVRSEERRVGKEVGARWLL